MGPRRGMWAASLVLLLLHSAGGGQAAGGKRSFGFRVQSRNALPTFRRSLLRNTTMPLHGAVKDYGWVGSCRWAARSSHDAEVQHHLHLRF